MKKIHSIFFIGLTIIFVLTLPVMISANSNQDDFVSLTTTVTKNRSINETTTIIATEATTLYLPIVLNKYPPTPPTISNISYILVERESVFCGGSDEYWVDFDYTDPDGDVGSAIKSVAVFSPSGDGGTEYSVVTRIGLSSDGFSGRATFTPCLYFTDPDTHVTITVTLIDRSGLESNALQIVIPRS